MAHLDVKGLKLILLIPRVYNEQKQIILLLSLMFRQSPSCILTTESVILTHLLRK